LGLGRSLSNIKYPKAKRKMTKVSILSQSAINATHCQTQKT
jgi:hypothetical protein